ncbi:UDP-glucose/GDP-mannose dehydrogenase family protein [Microvirga sp. W0021]|uniref:UDP-glucose 6-dehydrogenase n=1 Tax=Hohaiivirga grylli TaxID=3133970 RepID=A0ABV0BIB4_9HYPH
MHITMIGAGYVGLVSGACFADFGHDVICVDNNPAKIEALNKGEIPIYEPGLSELVLKNVREGRLSFTTNLGEAVQETNAAFIAVGTPSRRGDGHADLSYVYAAANELAQNLKGYTVIVDKSTVPVGTGDEVEKIIRETNPDADFDVASNPEFLREGAAISDFKRPDRIVIGVETERAADVMREIYRPLYLNQAPILMTSRRTAELTKYAANAFLATKITFINEMADLCEKVGANVQDVARGIGLDNRIGSKFLHAGPGYGGSCFPKDTLALIKTAQEYEAPSRIVEAVVEVNESRKSAMADKIIAACGGSVKGKTIALLGLTFKPNTDDMRDAPSIVIAQRLQQAGATIKAYDPEGVEQAKQVLTNIDYAPDPYSCLEGADAVAIITEWDAFRALDLKRVKTLLKSPTLIDLRNIYRPDEMQRQGFHYVSVGRSNS